jgi:hypothetical protein
VPRLVAAVAFCCVAIAAGGCGGGAGGGSSTRAPSGAAPIHHGGSAGRAARAVAAYRTAVRNVLTRYVAAQRAAFSALRGARRATTFAAALGRLRSATVAAASSLAGQHPPAPAAAAHRRLVAAFRSLARVLETAIQARNRADFTRLRRVGYRLASGELSRPIVAAARQIDAALG